MSSFQAEHAVRIRRESRVQDLRLDERHARQVHDVGPAQRTRRRPPHRHESRRDLLARAPSAIVLLLTVIIVFTYSVLPMSCFVNWKFHVLNRSSLSFISDRISHNVTVDCNCVIYLYS